MGKGAKENVNKAMRKRMSRRSRALFFAFLGGTGAVLASVAFTVAAHGEEYSKKVLSQQTRISDTVSGRRGDITDRNGTVLAYSNRIYTLILDSYVLNSLTDTAREKTINAVTKYFDIEAETIREKLENKPESRYERMLKEIPAEDYEEFKEATENDNNVRGVWFEESYERTYPFNTFASDVIGFATGANGGEIGLEKQYDDILTGVNGVSFSFVGEDRESETEVHDAADGYNIVTTIDYGVQKILEEKLTKYNAQKQSANTAAIVMDPNSGEILGMASWPMFDLNDPRNTDALTTLAPLADEDEALAETDADKLYRLWSNFCVSQSYEPGSTFKSVTVASALEEGKTHDGDEFYCSGSKEVEGFNIRCWMSDQGGHGTLDLEEALGDSCNVALMDIGFELGAERMVENQYAFGFGTKTGVDLPFETRGVLKDPEAMADSDIATNSFGQNLEVNMVQMVSAYSALINGGNYYQPHIVKAIRDSEGNTVKSVNPTVVRKPITKETSEHIKTYLKAGVEEYAVQYSKVEGYSMAGKTATAQKAPRTDKKWLISVMSFAPAENPEFLLYVLIDEPEGTTGGSGDGMDAQYLTKDVMTDLLPYMGVNATETEDSDDSDDYYYSDTDGGVNVPETEYEDTQDEYYDPDDG